MADYDEAELRQWRNAKLRKAVIEREYNDIGRYCPDGPDGPLHRISMYEDTVLHIVTHSKKKYLVLNLLSKVERSPLRSFLSYIKNTDGNTILHELATSDDMIQPAGELLKINSELLIVPNYFGEKPIFCAVRYGQSEMFEFLVKEMELDQLSPEE